MNVLIVDDDSSIRWILAKVLAEEGWQVHEAGDLQEAETMLQKCSPIWLFLDVYLPDGNGLDWLKAQDFTLPVVLMTAETTFDHAVQVYQAGVLEYLPKPFDLDEVRSLSQRLQLAASQTFSNPEPEPKIAKTTVSILGKSPVMQHLFRMIARVAASDLTVLIIGESGSGKELVAKALHEQSSRRHQPFIAINTAAIPADLLEAELFGHEKGAFTGADKARSGRFEQANGGTLFLDEIGDMPLFLQAKLLRVLEDGRVHRVGARESMQLDVRLLAATHKHLPDQIAEGRFREDLYYRLNVIPVQVPPLRERSDDIAMLAEDLLQQTSKNLGIEQPVLLDDAIALLKNYAWPGNVRELKNVMQRLVVLTPGQMITRSDVALALGSQVNSAMAEGDVATVLRRSLKEYMGRLGFAEVRHLHEYVLDMVQPTLLKLVLEHASGNQSKTAEMLGLNRNTLRKLLKKYDIRSQDFRR